MALRHHHLPPVSADLNLQPGNQAPHARLAHPCAFLLDQPLPDPARGLPLLPWRRQIRDQPAPDRRHISTQHRRRPRRRLTRRRDRINERLPDRATMHPVPVRERPDRQTLITTITSDTFELLHSRSLLQTPPPLLNALADDTKAPGLLGRGWGHFKPALRPQLGPLQAGTLRNWCAASRARVRWRSNPDPAGRIPARMLSTPRLRMRSFDCARSCPSRDWTPAR